jgi:hypothetical protein
MAHMDSIEMPMLSNDEHRTGRTWRDPSETFVADPGLDGEYFKASSSQAHLVEPSAGGMGGTIPTAPYQQQVPTEQDAPFLKPKRRAISIMHWVWEAVNAVLLVAMIAAVVITLRLHDGQPAPDWPLSITINALVSIYAFIFKGNMAFILASCIGQFQWSWYRSPRPLKDVALYQEAGRGAMGSFLWLCSLHLRQPVVALAAIITIAGIALDPFFQQLVQSNSCSVVLLGVDKPSVPRTNYLELTDLPSSLQPAVISGFYQAQNLSDFDCSTGNCTFSAKYDTLGFCSHCDDISYNITIQEDCIVDHAMTGGSEKGVCDAKGDDGNTFTTVWNLTTTAWPFWVDFYYNSTTKTGTPEDPTVFAVLGQWREADVLRFNSTSVARQGANVGVVFPEADTAIFKFEPDNWNNSLVGCSDANTNDTWYCRGYGAANCILQPCVRTYTASIDAGQVSEVMVDQSNPALTWGYGAVAHDLGNGIQGEKDIWGLLNKSCVTDQERAQLTTEGYDMGSNDRWLAYNVTSDPPNTTTNTSSTFPDSMFARNCVYLIDGSFVETLWTRLLADMLIDSVNRTTDSTVTKSDSNSINTFAGSQQVLYLFNSGKVNMTGIDTAFDNLAQALTLWIRENGHANYSERATGEVFHIATCLQVNWIWLILPAVLALFTLIILGLTVTSTLWLGLPIWKSSPLAYLLHGPAGLEWVDDTLVAPAHQKRSTYDLGTETGMKTVADRIWVTLIDEDEEPRLRQVGARTRKL